MGTYLEFWKEALRLGPSEVKWWLDTIRPTRGLTVNFNGIRCNDIELEEALRYCDEVYEAKKVYCASSSI